MSMLKPLVSWRTLALVLPLHGGPTRALPPLDPDYGSFANSVGRQSTLSIAREDSMWKAPCGILALPQFVSLSEKHYSRRAKEIDPLLRIAIAGQSHEVFYQHSNQRAPHLDRC